MKNNDGQEKESFFRYMLNVFIGLIVFGIISYVIFGDITTTSIAKDGWPQFEKKIGMVSYVDGTADGHQIIDASGFISFKDDTLFSDIEYTIDEYIISECKNILFSDNITCYFDESGEIEISENEEGEVTLYLSTHGGVYIIH